MSALVGVAEHYAQFVQLCRARIAELGITFETVDGLCGFPDRYTATLLCEKKTMSIYSFFIIARALALLPAFEHDAAQLEVLRASKQWIVMRRNGSRYRAKRRGGAVRFANHIDFYRQIGRKGAISRAMSQKKRKQQTANARAARWSQ